MITMVEAIGEKPSNMTPIERQRQFQSYLKERGVCVVCRSEKARPGRTTCSICAKCGVVAQREYRNRKREERRMMVDERRKRRENVNA